MKIKKKYFIILVGIIVIIGLSYFGYSSYKSFEKKKAQEKMFTFQNFDTTLTQDVIDNFKRQFDEAVKYIVKNPSDYVGWTVAGNMKKSANDYYGARDVYLQGLKNVPAKNTDVLLSNLADLYYHFIKDYEVAEEYYLRAIEIKPMNLQNYIELSIMYRVEFKDQDKAIGVIKKGLENNQNNKELMIHLANTYKKFSMLDEARNIWNELIKTYPENEEYKKELENIK